MVAIFYASKNGATKEVANLIKTELGAEIFCIKDVKNTHEFEKFETLIFASSNYGFGQLNDDWLEKIDLLNGVNFDNKKVALVGVGNQERHPKSFCSNLVDFLPKIKAAKKIGMSEKNGYEFDESAAFINGKFIGLCVDFKGDLHWQNRVKSWCENLKAQIK